MRLVMIFPLILAGCGLVPDRFGLGPAPEAAIGEERTGVTVDVGQRPQARPDRGEAAVDPRRDSDLADGALGRTVATLGNAGEPGIWLKTPLVSARQMGRVVDPATGKAVSVTLIPIEGPVTAGSRLSLRAMQALGLGLTDLVQVDVFVQG